MTVFMTFIGLFVFVFSTFTKPFKVALKRLWMFSITGVIIDMFIITISVLTGYAALN